MNKPKLFLLPFAGGNCYSYNFLKEELQKKIEFIPLELPGRGRRMNEDFIKSRKDCIQDYFNQIIPLLKEDTKFLIYGHSMGANLGLGLALKLENIGKPPMQLIFSGNAGPDTEPEHKKNRHLLEGEEFKNELREIGGMPDEILNNEELYAFFEPILKQDFSVIGESSFDRDIVDIPIIAIMGDKEETNDKIRNWGEYTRSTFDYAIFDGDHFFIHKHAVSLANKIIEAVSKVSIQKSISSTD